jgi:hypothetical protein
MKQRGAHRSAPLDLSAIEEQRVYYQPLPCWAIAIAPFHYRYRRFTDFQFILAYPPKKFECERAFFKTPYATTHNDMGLGSVYIRHHDGGRSPRDCLPLLFYKVALHSSRMDSKSKAPIRRTCFNTRPLLVLGPGPPSLLLRVPPPLPSVLAGTRRPC